MDPFCGGLDRRNRPLNFPAPKFFSIFFAFLIKDQMVNYMRLACKLRTYKKCDPTVGFQNMNSKISY